jgi:hypothetical protein
VGRRHRAFGAPVMRPSLVLLIDIKAEGEAVYAALRETLSNYRAMLTIFRPQRIETNAVTVIISGVRAWSKLAAETERWVGLEGQSRRKPRKPERKEKTKNAYRDVHGPTRRGVSYRVGR